MSDGQVGPPEWPGRLTTQELEVLDISSRLARAFAKLPPLHSSEKDEFVLHIHAIQTLLMSRCAVRAHPEIFGTHGSEEVGQ